jgi:hypothetical protein
MIKFLPNEHFINQPEGNTEKEFTDSCFEIYGREHKKYHLECQSTTDSSMLIRMFEYDAQVALDGGSVQGNHLTVTFPHSGVLYLRHTRNTPDTMYMKINTPGGNISYEIPVLKLQTYSIDEIFEKDLLFLLPFHIFCYEKKLKIYEEDKEMLEELRQEYAEILNRLEELCLNGHINEYVNCTLIDMSKKVVNNLASKYEHVKKGVTSVMGGKVLEHEAKTILRRGLSEGEIIGRRNGLVELVRDGLLSISEAAKRLNMNEEELRKYL